MKVLLSNVIAVINAEPELPGKMSVAMEKALTKAIINNDMDMLTEIMRVVVRVTKKNILSEVLKIPEAK